jgi:hypothetical protein
MKTKSLCLLFGLFYSLISSAQYTLKTPDGHTVQLHTNGTWEYVSTNTSSTMELSKEQTLKYASKNKRFTVEYEPLLWAFDTVNKDEGFQWDALFHSRDLELTAFCFETRLMLPLEKEDLESYMREQYSAIGKLVSLSSKKETINGMVLTQVDVELEVTGIPYIYRGYIYSDYLGSFQFWASTQKTVFLQDEKRILKLINSVRKA